jgi:hypothetical protein
VLSLVPKSVVSDCAKMNQAVQLLKKSPSSKDLSSYWNHAINSGIFLVIQFIFISSLLTQAVIL